MIKLLFLTLVYSILMFIIYGITGILIGEFDIKKWKDKTSSDVEDIIANMSVVAITITVIFFIIITITGLVVL